jgi:hypothetical protein
MFLSLLFRKEVLILGGLTAAFAAPMVRSGELSLGKVMDWAVNGIGPRPEQSQWADQQSFGIWAPDLATTPQAQNLVPTTGSNSVFKFLESIFEVQTVPADSEYERQGTTPLPSQANLEATGGTDLSQPVAERSANQTTPSGITIPTSAEAAAPRSAAAPSPASGSSLTDGIPVLDLREIIRFDVSPYWVQQRWPQCTPLTLDIDGYYGFRVPLVADQRVGALSGALTYSFDAQAVVQRIQFQGSVQDIAPLQQLLTQYFHFRPIADKPNLLAPIHEQAARGMLRFSEPIIEAPGLQVRLREAAFEINSTKGRYQLSEAYRRLAVQ